MSSVLHALAANIAILLGVVAIAEGILAAWLYRRNDDLRLRLRRANDAAEDAARAAALAAPGGIDPEIVIHLLRTGQAATLDVVHDLMERRERSEAAASR